MDTTQGGLLAWSAKHSLASPTRHGAAAAMDDSSAAIMVVVRGQLFREGIQSVLESQGRIISSNCETLEQLSARPDTLPPPDLFVVGSGGSENMVDLCSGIRKLRARLPAAKWLVLTPLTDPNLLRETLEAGVDALLPEDSAAEVLQLLTRLVLLGQSFVPASLARVLSGRATPTDVQSVAETHASPRPNGKTSIINGESAGRAPHNVAQPQRIRSATVANRDIILSDPEGPRRIELSDRENEILGCLVFGHSNKIIARQLDIAEATVKVHVKGLLRKMQVSNRTQAAIRALKFPVVVVTPPSPADGPMK